MILLITSAPLPQAQERETEREAASLSLFPNKIYWLPPQVKGYQEHNLAQCKVWTEPKHHWECEKATACSIKRITQEIPFIMYLIAGNQRSKAKLSTEDQAIYTQYMEKLGDINHQCALEF